MAEPVSVSLMIVGDVALKTPEKMVSEQPNYILNSTNKIQTMIFNPQKFDSIMNIFYNNIQKKKTVTFEFPNGAENTIRHDDVYQSLLYKLSKTQNTPYVIQNMDFGKLHWYYLADILIVDYLKNKQELNEQETQLLNVISKFLTRVKLSKYITTIWNDCLDYINTTVFMGKPDLFYYWKNSIQEHINAYTSDKKHRLKAIVYDYKDWILNKFSPGNVGPLSYEHIESIFNNIRLPEFSFSQLLYYIWKSGYQLLESGYVTEDLYISFPDHVDALDRFFKDSEGDFLDIATGMNNLYQHIRTTSFYYVFGEMNIITEVVPAIHLSYIYYIMLRYLNDGHVLDGKYQPAVLEIQKNLPRWIKEQFPITQPRDIRSIFSWCDRVRDYFNYRIPNISTFINLPTFTLIREDNIFTGTYDLSGEIYFTNMNSRKDNNFLINGSSASSKKFQMIGDF